MNQTQVRGGGTHTRLQQHRNRCFAQTEFPCSHLSPINSHVNKTARQKAERVLDAVCALLEICSPRRTELMKICQMLMHCDRSSPLFASVIIYFQILRARNIRNRACHFAHISTGERMHLHSWQSEACFTCRLWINYDCERIIISSIDILWQCYWFIKFTHFNVLFRM